MNDIFVTQPFILLYMKKLLKWVIGVPVGLFLLVLGAGAILMLVDPEGVAQRKREGEVRDSLAAIQETQDDSVNRLETAHKASMEKRVPFRKLDDEALYLKLDDLLRKQGLTFCEAYEYVENSESSIRRSFEDKYGVKGTIDRTKELNAAYTESWNSYRKQHGIPDSIRIYLAMLGMGRCDQIHN